MIKFNCPYCKIEFEVEDALAGARVACSECDTHFYVPAPAEELPPKESPPPLPKVLVVPPPLPNPLATPPPLPPQKLSPRQRRLAADFQMMRERFTHFPLIHLERTHGNPPESYVVSYRIRSIERLAGESVVFRDYHEVEIRLPGTYPRTPPICRMITPIFHPNIEPAIICIGDHWTASERLCDLVVRIGEMIAYQAHNIKSPLDGEAAMWTDLHMDILPIDCRDLTPPDP